MSLQRTFSAIDLIKERRGKKGDGQTLLDSQPAVPSMLDVLKDMSKVKLRSVKRYLNREKGESIQIHLQVITIGVYGLSLYITVAKCTIQF